MEREILIKLTNDLYRLTLLFPKKEPLRYKVREVAVNFLANPNSKDLEILDKFFEVILVQNWVSPSSVLEIKKGYSDLRADEYKTADIREIIKLSEPQPQQLPERQKKIISFLKENGKVQVWQVKQFLPQVTKRTLRRDFEHLLSQGVVERMGERNNTFYQLKSELSSEPQTF